MSWGRDWWEQLGKDLDSHITKVQLILKALNTDFKTCERILHHHSIAAISGVEGEGLYTAQRNIWELFRLQNEVIPVYSLSSYLDSLDEGWKIHRIKTQGYCM